jgi:hypothetical protein
MVGAVPTLGAVTLGCGGVGLDWGGVGLDWGGVGLDCGCVGGVGADALTTTSVSAEYASALPAPLVAVTRTLLRPPTSHLTGEYPAWVYPTIGEQLLPVWSQ